MQKLYQPTLTRKQLLTLINAMSVAMSCNMQDEKHLEIACSKFQMTTPMECNEINMLLLKIIAVDEPELLNSVVFIDKCATSIPKTNR